jgi:tetratricopeptide (TPR) repeat protein
MPEQLSPRVRLWLGVAVVALVAAGAVVGVTLATRQTPEQPQAQEGKPPLGRNLPTPAAAQIRAAFTAWPKGSLRTMQKLDREYPKDRVVQFYVGVALLWAGYGADAVAPLERAKKLGRDTVWEVQADDWLHPDLFSGYPIFHPIGNDPLLARGSQLQQQGHQHSALRLFERAARRSPESDEAQVAAAVARFDKDDVTPAFSHLGPLTRRFPKSQSVRYYLGLLLAWTGQRDEACAQFTKTVSLGAKTELGTGAGAFLERVCKGGSSPPPK